MLDVSLGREFGGDATRFRVDLQLFNVFNNDAHDAFQTLVVAPGDSFYPRAHVLPRRLMVRFGLEW
ncbi:MAG: hypothetical protein VYE73_07750 [Acidobacteriota bacterium]|nr:hypothetical protein [Acidobacteriota bacterium]